MIQKHVTDQESGIERPRLLASLGTARLWRLVLRGDRGDVRIMEFHVTDIIPMSGAPPIFVGTTLDGTTLNLHTNNRWLTISWR